jgi:hypothetical protein
MHNTRHVELRLRRAEPADVWDTIDGQLRGAEFLLELRLVRQPDGTVDAERGLHGHTAGDGQL